MSNDGSGGMDRRDFLRHTAMAGAAVAAGGLSVLALRQAVPDDEPAPAPILHPESREPVRPSDLAGPAPVVLVAEYRDKPAVVYKLPLARLRGASEARGYDAGQFAVRHPDEPNTALLAYDGRCTHLHCTVGWNVDLPASRDVADYDGDGENDGRILCPCHQSQFDVYDLATNVPGSPAPRPLDVIPLRLVGVGADVYLLGLERIRQERPRQADRRGPGATFSL